MRVQKNIFTMAFLRNAVLPLLLLLSSWTLRAQYDTDHFFFRGQLALNEGRYLDALNSFSVIIRIDDSFYEAYFFRGIAKYNLGDFGGAESDFDRAIDLNPVYTLAYHYRAITLSRMGEYDRALNDLKRAIELRPGYYGLYFSRGVTYFLSQQFEKAVEDFDRFSCASRRIRPLISIAEPLICFLETPSMPSRTMTVLLFWTVLTRRDISVAPEYTIPSIDWKMLFPTWIMR